MGVADDIFSDEEKKYFESRGQNLPEAGVAEKQGDEGEAEEPRADHYEPEPSQSADDPADARSDEEQHQGEVESGAEDEGYRDSSAEDKPKRDFEKAYHSERHKRSELKERLAQVERQNQEIANYLQQMQTQQHVPQHVPQQPKVEAPNPDEDPLGYAQHQIKELQQRNSEYDEYLREVLRQEEIQKQQVQQQQQYNAMVSDYQQKGAEYASEHPDFNDAYQYFNEKRASALAERGYTRDQIVQAIRDEEIAVAADAYRRGVNPVELLHNVIRAEGWQPQAAQPKKSKLSKVEKGMKTSKRLPSSRGSSADKFDMHRIDEMTPREFDDYFAHVKSQQRGTRNW